MNLKALGYNDDLEKARIENNWSTFELGRVISEHKERYIVATEKGEFEAEITGNMRFTAKRREDFPATGDWVCLTSYDDSISIIHHILPRKTVVARQAVGQFGATQIIAANIDYAFLIQAVDRDFNLNRLERYLTICYSSKVKPIIVLTKTDLISEQEVQGIKDSIKQRLQQLPVIAVSNETHEGYEDLQSIFEKGKTYCMLGSSGVGKSTLLNNLSGKVLMKTGSISNSTSKGKHITSHRELVILETGGLLIDNPGMREVGIVDNSNGLNTTFDTVITFSHNCRFSDCTHTKETGCAVLEAVERGDIDRSTYDSYLKMEREKKHFESSIAERRKKEKDFSKVLKNYKKVINKNKG